MNELGIALRHLLSERGISLHELSRRSHWDTGYLSKVINGRKTGSYALVRDLDRILGADGELLDLWTGTQGSPVARDISAETKADLSGSALTQGPRSGPAAILSDWGGVHEPPGPAVMTADQASLQEIEHLEQTAQLFRTWNHQRGGGLGRKAVIGQLSEVAGILRRSHPVPQRGRLLGIACELALITAHMSADMGDKAAAYRYLDLALAAAREGQAPGLGARIACAIARRMLDDGDPATALDILGHATRSLRGVPEEMTAMLCTTQAWICATLGDHKQMTSCLDRASSLVDNSASLFGAAEFAGISGACFEVLAGCAAPPRRVAHARQAERHISVALELRQPFYVRSRVLDLAGLANVRLYQGEPDEAMRTAGEALESATSIRSDRTARRIHGLAIRALKQYPDVRQVTEFADMVRSRLPVA